MLPTHLTASSQNVRLSPRLKRAESYVTELSFVEQLWLMEWLAQHIREAALRASQAKYAALATMAADADIQREMRDINSEFLVTEADGLDKYQ
jgi:hypothetical protein